MYKRPHSRFTLLILFFIAIAAWSQPLSPTCTVLINKIADACTELKIGDTIRLKLNGATPLSAIYMGTRDSHDLFYAVNGGRIIRVPECKMSYSAQDGRFVEPRREQLPLVAHQETPTCAAHAVMNCLRVLHDLNQLSNEALETGVTSQQRQLMNYLVNLLYTQIPPNMPFAARIQSHMLEAFFTHHDIPITTTQSTRALKQHLLKGLPAVLSTGVHTDPTNTVKGYDDTGKPIGETSDLMPCSYSNPSCLGGHAVLAIRFFKTGWLSGKVLVLDSGVGEFALWDYADLKKAVGFLGSGKASFILVGE